MGQFNVPKCLKIPFHFRYALYKYGCYTHFFTYIVAYSTKSVPSFYRFILKWTMEFNKTIENESSNPNFQYGRWLSSPPPGEEVVISGVSGRFPESENIYEFRDNLFNKKQMVSENEKRWKVDVDNVPKKSGHIDNINKFDAGYFGLHYRQANFMDPGLGVIMKTVIEAIMDAGINPSELEGSKTGVFLGRSWSDAEYPILINLKAPQNFAITG